MTSFNVIDSDEEEGDEKPVVEELLENSWKRETVLGEMKSSSDQDVLVGEGGCADCSALSATSACSSISQLITEEDLIDSLFHACDTLRSGQVPVSSLLDYIKCTTQATEEQGTNADLEDLWLQFDPNGVDVSVDINTCRKVMTQWVSQVRRASGSELCCNSLNQDLIEFSPAKVRPRNSDPAGGISSSPIQKTSNVSANDRSTFESMEMHGKDSSIQNIELMAEISELEFQNKKLQSQLLESQSQTALVDDQNVQLTLERDDLKRKLASLHRVAEANRDLLKENLDLKTLVSNLEESQSVAQAEKSDLEKAYESQIDALEKDLSSASVELESLKAEKEILVQTNTNQLKQRRKEKKEAVKAREKINTLQAQLKDCESLLDGSRKTAATMAENGFLASPISGLLANASDESQNAERRIRIEEENCSSIRDEIRSLIDEFDPDLESPFCEKFCLNHYLEMDRQARKLLKRNENFSRLAEMSPTSVPRCSSGRNRNGNDEGTSRGDAFRSDFIVTDAANGNDESETKTDAGIADLLLVCRKVNFIRHLCTPLLIRHWRNWTGNNSDASPIRPFALVDPKSSSSHTDAATQALLPKGEAFADVCSVFPESDVEDWSFLHSTQDAELKDRGEILSIIQNNLDEIKVFFSVLVANLPATNAATAALQLARSKHRPGRNPPFICQQVSHDSNNMSIDSGIPVDLSPSSPECGLKLQKRWPKDGRPFKQALLPDTKSRSLDQSRGVQEGKVIRGYRRTLSCPVLQSRCSLIARGIQTDVSCVRMAVDDERMFRVCRTPPDNAKDASETSAVIKPNLLTDGSSGIDSASFDMPSSNCPSHGSRKLPMLPEEDHEDPSSPLQSATSPRHTSRMFVSLRATPPPYRPPPPPPSACLPSNFPSGVTSVSSTCLDDRIHDQTSLSSHVRCSGTDSPSSDTEIRQTPRIEESSLHRSAAVEQERQRPEHLLRKHSSKRRLGFEGSSTAIRRSAAVELDEFDSPVADAGETETAGSVPNGAGLDAPTKPDADSPPEEQSTVAPTVEPPKWSGMSQLASWTKKRRKSSLELESLSEQEMEDEFIRLSLANRLDKSTLGQRLELHQRQRNLAERDVEKELIALKTALNDVQAKSQTFYNAEVRHSLTLAEQRVDVILGGVARVSGRAEAYGGIQKEMKNCHAFALLIKYAEIEKNRCKQFEKQLEEVRKMNQRLSHENTIHQLIASGAGGTPRSIVTIDLAGRRGSPLNNTPKPSRRRASVAIDSSPSLEAIVGLCTCPKAAGEAQSAVRTIVQCPIHSTRFKSGRRSSICAAMMPVRSSPTEEWSANPPAAVAETSLSSLDPADDGSGETRSTSEQRVEEDFVEEPSKEDDEEEEEIEEESTLEEWRLAEPSDLFDSSERGYEEDEDFDCDRSRASPDRFARRWQVAEIWPNLRYVAGGLLIATALWTLFCSFFPLSWPFASCSTRSSYVPSSWYSWEELFRPYLNLRHHSSPPV